MTDAVSAKGKLAKCCEMCAKLEKRNQELLFVAVAADEAAEFMAVAEGHLGNVSDDFRREYGRALRTLSAALLKAQSQKGGD